VISVVIPTFQRPDRIREAVARIAAVDFPADQYEIVVVDDGSEPPLDAATLRSPPNVALTLVRMPHGGCGAARNAGVARARGELIVFTADDCEPERDWLRAFATAHAEFPECALGGEILHGLPDNPYSTAADLLIRYMRHRFNDDPQRANFFTPNNLAVPAASFRVLGGFDQRFDSAGEDLDFCARWVEAGHRMFHVPQAQVRHVHPLSLVAFLRLQFIHGRGSMLHRRVRSRRSGRPLRLEGLDFYLRLITYPLSAPGVYGSRHIALLAASQIAVAAGAVRALFEER